MIAIATFFFMVPAIYVRTNSCAQEARNSFC